MGIGPMIRVQFSAPGTPSFNAFLKEDMVLQGSPVAGAIVRPLRAAACARLALLTEGALADYEVSLLRAR